MARAPNRSWAEGLFGGARLGFTCQLARDRHNLDDANGMLGMQAMNDGLTSLDMRTLRFLQLLLRTSSVTRTAMHLGISQPAASRILARVRDLIGDPVLIRTQSGYQLTDHALSLNEPVDVALSAIADVFRPSTFDPAQSSHCYRIASTDYGVAAVLGPMIEVFAVTAPALRFDVSPLVPQSFSDLEKGAIDLLLYADLDARDDLLIQKLFDETYEVLFRQGHPLEEHAVSKQALTPQDVSPYRLVEFSFPGTTGLKPDTIMREDGDGSHAVFQQPYFTTLPFLVRETDAVAAVPKRLAEQVRKLTPLCSAPFQPGCGFPYHLVRHERSRHNPAVNWLKERALKITKFD
ncbi:LysR family transcriptional regulator [Ruegeria sp. 2012CJ41-6]|uniref:LysR family transcriptional regulator n=1 Tax=Ruegeria spongiae TaxID=2942209 RepID=A0ABT0Q8J0_9RHOB|nr:LysR family transcriptional regulator [Ruegeria spongiae]MCL6286196.1 LysR family transcriptional regulator [Ruegeria spongiae]